jgi:hypothetical protein
VLKIGEIQYYSLLRWNEFVNGSVENAFGTRDESTVTDHKDNVIPIMLSLGCEDGRCRT